MAEAPPLILVVLFAVAGALVGSFLALVSVRLPEGAPFANRRSRCGGCGRTLLPRELIPLASYTLLRGRCAGCGAAIPRRYPLMEGACALIGAWAALSPVSLAGSVLTALLGWQLLLIAVVDGEHFWLPDQLTLPLLSTGAIAAALLGGLTLVDAALGAAAGFIVLWLTALAYRRVRGRDGLGGGDPYLLAAGGAWVGWTGLPSVLLWAAMAGLSVPAARILLGRPVSGEDRMPFGVFLALGVWLTWVFGPLGVSQ